MEVLCEECRFRRKFCTGNKENVKDIYHYPLREMDIPESGLYIFYKCALTGNPVKNPAKCKKYEPRPGAGWPRF
jgi:hypothetical protein